MIISHYEIVFAKKREAKNLRSYLKDLRRSKSLTQAELAKRTGVSQNYYSDLENGKKGKKMSIALLERLANAFQVSPESMIEAECKYFNAESDAH